MQQKGELMKKIAIAFCLIFLVSLPMFGGGFKLLVGPAITNISYNQDYSPAVKSGLLQFSGGLGLELSFTTNIAVEVDLLFAPGGAKFEETVPAGTFSETFKGYGLSLPVLLKVSFLPGTTPFIVAGGAVGYTLSQKDFWINPWDSGEDDLTDDVNRLQYGLVFGGGVDLALAGMTFSLEARYSLGLSNLIKDPWPGQKATIQNIFILADYKF
jgi:opacity protein-like surface antigen